MQLESFKIKKEEKESSSYLHITSFLKQETRQNKFSEKKIENNTKALNREETLKNTSTFRIFTFRIFQSNINGDCLDIKKGKEVIF